MQSNRQVIHWLFETGAFRVSEPGQVFWYTSGKFGPYYVNTHFLFGNEEDANELLDLIDQTKDCPLALPRMVGKRCQAQYHSHEIYRGLVDLLADEVKDIDFDFVSGGERRDYFFSFALAEKLKKYHISICKDGRSFLSTSGFHETHELKLQELQDAKVLHVADLVTEASSYFRAWLPSLYNAGAKISDTFAIVDRDQGGRESLGERGIRLQSFIRVDRDFFREALDLGKINREQFEQLCGFKEDPDRFILNYLRKHPNFLDEEEERGGEIAERVARFRKLNLSTEDLS